MPTPVVVPVTSITRAGVAPATPTAGDATNGHTVANDGNVFILAKNTNGASTARTITFAFSKHVDGQTVSPVTHSLAAGASLYLGPFSTPDYGADLAITVSHAELVLSAYHL